MNGYIVVLSGERVTHPYRVNTAWWQNVIQRLGYSASENMFKHIIFYYALMFLIFRINNILPDHF